MEARTAYRSSKSKVGIDSRKFHLGKLATNSYKDRILWCRDGGKVVHFAFGLKSEVWENGRASTEEW